MALEVGIVGLPNVGKSTLFNALTAAGALAANYPFATIEPNVGIVSVPDPNLARIAALIQSEKILPAQVSFVDIAGLVKGASTGEGLGNKFLANIRETDAICHVVRCFEDNDIQHVEGNVDPLRDIETIDTELCLSDVETVTKALDNATRKARAGDADAKLRMAICQKAVGPLNDARPLRLQEWTEDEMMELKKLGLITIKKVLYVANVAEDDLTGQSPHVQTVRDHAAQEGGNVVPVCAKIESELAELDDADKAEMLAGVGLNEPALASLGRAAYEMLGLQSYYTAGPKEIRAWTIPKGATAPQAAGVIHTDFERGFIRAEVYAIEDLETYKTEKAVREAGKLRTEGKGYIMRPGDVTHFLFNV